MATNAFVEIDLPAAANLADYTGIWYDLLSAREFAQFLLNELKREAPNWSLSDPLMVAVTVRYARSFASGVRMRLGADALAVLTPDQRRKHDYFCSIRDKYVAHSVNTFEESQPVARYWVERVQDEGITSVECNHHRITGLSTQDLNDVIELTNVLLGYVDARLKEEKTKILEIVRKMPLEKVLAGKPKLFRPDTSNPEKRRR